MPKEGLGLSCFTLKLLLCRQKPICCKVTFQNYFYFPAISVESWGRIAPGCLCGVLGAPRGMQCRIILVPTGTVCASQTWDPAVVSLSPALPASLQPWEKPQIQPRASLCSFSL